MRTVVFVAPFSLPTTARFTQAIAHLPGVRAIGIFQERPREDLGLADVVLLQDVGNPDQLGRALDGIVARYGGIHRLLGILEALQEPLADQRARLGLPGLQPEAARKFRDKDSMKAALREAGVPVAASVLVEGQGEPDEIVGRVGLPLVLKPVAGAGAAATTKVQSRQSLIEALSRLPRPLLAESFLTGEEHSMETWVLHGRPVFSAPTRYFPSALEVAENPHLQWCVFLPRDTRPYAEAAKIIDHAVLSLGMHTGLAHAEWFRRPDGSVAIGEIGARPPGARIVDLHSQAFGVDWYRAWARLVVDEVFEGPWQRKYAVAGVYLRGAGQGRVVGIDGLDEAQRRMGVYVVEARLPQQGQARAGGYEGDGFVMLRHEADDVVKQAVREVFQHVRVRYA
jgi:hypothetical protein